MIDFNAFYRENFTRQVKVINRHVHDYDLSEDIVQDSYVKAIMYLPSYNPERSTAKTWFNMIMFNTMRSYKSVDKRVTMSVDEEGNLCESIQETTPYEKIADNIDLVEKEIRVVKSEESRNIIRLYYLLGYHSDEIRDILEIGQSKITSCCSRFKKRLLVKYDLEI